MSTTIFPVKNSGPSDEGYGPRFPEGTALGMLSDIRRLTESGPKFPKPKKSPKKFISEAEGKKTAGSKVKFKAAANPKNLRASDKKKKKVGPFGESYTKPSGGESKGIRVAESMRRSFSGRMSKFRRATEKAPPGREDQVRKLKKNPDIDNPYAVSWSSYNRSKD